MNRQSFDFYVDGVSLQPCLCPFGVRGSSSTSLQQSARNTDGLHHLCPTAGQLADDNVERTRTPYDTKVIPTRSRSGLGDDSGLPLRRFLTLALRV